MMSDLTPEQRQAVYEEEKAKREAEQSAQKTPSRASKKKKAHTVGCLVIFFIIAVLYVVYKVFPKDEVYRPAQDLFSTKTTPEKPSARSCFDIKINKFTTNEYGYYEVVGAVKNTSTRAFKFVEVKAQFLNKNKDVVGEETTYVTGTDYLMPGETKSYKFMGENQPDYKSVTVVFDSANEVE